MQLVNICQIQLSHLQSSEGMCQWNEVTILCKFVHNNKDGIVPTGLREAFYKIHADDSPRLCRNWKRFKKTRCLNMLHLGLLADLTSFHIILDALLQLRPSKELLNSRVGGLNPRVASNATIVESLHNVLLG